MRRSKRMMAWPDGQQLVKSAATYMRAAGGRHDQSWRSFGHVGKITAATCFRDMCLTVSDDKDSRWCVCVYSRGVCACKISAGLEAANESSRAQPVRGGGRPKGRDDGERNEGHAGQQRV